MNYVSCKAVHFMIAGETTGDKRKSNDGRSEKKSKAAKVGNRPHERRAREALVTAPSRGDPYPHRSVGGRLP